MISERLRLLQTLAGFKTFAAFAEAAGIPKGTAQKHKDRDSVPKKAAQKYCDAARGTEAHPAWLLYGTGPAPKESDLAKAVRLGGGPKKPIPFPLESSDLFTVKGSASRGTVEVKEAAEIAGGGYFMLSESVVDLVARPAHVSAAARLFALYMPTDEMEPRYERGDLLFVNEGLALEPNKDVVLLSAPDSDGRRRGMVRRLLKITATDYDLLHYKPERTKTTVRRPDWPTVYRIVSSRNR